MRLALFYHRSVRTLTSFMMVKLSLCLVVLNARHSSRAEAPARSTHSVSFTMRAKLDVNTSFIRHR
jgi:hypothetical protein